MPASYPGSAKVFTTKSDGPGNTILAAHINDLQLEVSALETDLIGGLPMARGGTGLTSAPANTRIPYSNGTTLTSNSAFLFDGTTFTTPGQIAFPAAQSASTNVNTLDDYEEGDWTPAIGGSGGQSGQVYTLQKGRYTKIGKLVTAHFYIQLSTLGVVTTSAQVQGLPFTIENTASMNIAATVSYWTNMTSSFTYIGGFASPNTTALTLYGLTAAATGLTALVQGDLANSSILCGTITYMATA